MTELMLVRDGAEPTLLAEASALLDRYDAVLCPTDGAGWWVFGVRDPAYADRIGEVPETYAGAALAAARAGLRVAVLPERPARDR